MTIQPVCLSIAGLDPSGGAGVIADVRTFSAFGCFPTAVITSITFQNTNGVFGAEHQSGVTVSRQADPVFQDYSVAAVKTGMLPSKEVIEATAAIIEIQKVKSLVVDPVVRSTSGYDLIDDPALRSLIKRMFPLSILITPNIPEAERIAGFEIRDRADLERAAVKMRELGATNILIKGGHVVDGLHQPGVATDHLFTPNGVQMYEGEYFKTMATHGTGCVLSAAIAANLAFGNDLHSSIAAAKKFVSEAIRTAPHLGRGHSPINIKTI